MDAVFNSVVASRSSGYLRNEASRQQIHFVVDFNIDEKKANLPTRPKIYFQFLMKEAVAFLNNFLSCILILESRPIFVVEHRIACVYTCFENANTAVIWQSLITTF